MKKKIILTSLIIILIPFILFLPPYVALIYSTTVNSVDYSADIPGKWDAYQYYYESQRIACNEETWMSLTVENNKLTLEGTVLPETECEFKWLSGTSISYESNEKINVFHLSIDEKGNLKLVTENDGYVIMLRKSKG